MPLGARSHAPRALACSRVNYEAALRFARRAAPPLDPRSHARPASSIRVSQDRVQARGSGHALDTESVVKQRTITGWARVARLYQVLEGSGVCTIE